MVSFFKLDVERYSFKFGNKSVSLFTNTSFIGSSILHEGLYQLKLDDLFAETLLTLHHNIRTKHSWMDENSSILWYKRMGHISKEKLETLVKYKILLNIDFTNLGMCVDCIKNK